jgi:hypothetical protein
VSAARFQGQDAASTGAPSRIRAEDVELSEHPALIGRQPDRSGAILIKPLLEGQTIRAIEVSCSCGQHLTVQCVYAPVTPELAPAGETI